jgi:hypothetical protein
MKRCFAILLIAWLAPLVAAQTDAKVEPIAPYVDDNTFLVGRIDVARLPIDDLIRRLEQIVGKAPGGDANELRQAHGTFTRNGGKELFVLLNVGDGPNEPLIVVPLGGAADSDALADSLTKLFEKSPLKIHRRAKVLLAGTPRALESALARDGKVAPALTKALAAVESSALQWALLPPRPFLRAQEELVPNLPKELGGGPITTVTKAFVWAALGVDIAPKLGVKAIVQASDADAAKQLHDVLEQALQHLEAEAERDVPMIAKALPLLRPKIEGAQLVLRLEEQAIENVLRPAVAQVRGAAGRAQSMNNVKQIALAMHNYHDVFKAFPAHANYANKKPLLSWRVHILPFIEQDGLYRQFKLDEPWDSPHNKALIKQMPETYRSPLAKNLPAGKTTYLTPVGPNMIFGSPEGMSMLKITDGTSNTILTVEADEAKAVFWTQPEDLKVDQQNPLAGLTSQERKGFIVGFADGSVRFVSNSIDPQVLWRLFTADGGEVVEPAELK